MDTEFCFPKSKNSEDHGMDLFPKFKFFCYDESILLALIAIVETPTKVDTNTKDVRRGRFVRVYDNCEI